jgi:membrane-associated phospholipid phosphatase
MGRDARLKTGLILGVVGLDALLIALLGLEYPVSDFATPVVILTVLAGVAIFYQRVRPTPNFVCCTAALMQLVAFSTAFVVLTYCIAATGQPLVDAELARFDESLGVQVPAVMAWANARPQFASALDFAYNTILPQTALVVVILGFLGERRSLERFMLTFILCALVTGAAFYFWPADGPFTAYGYATNASQANYLEHFHGMRSGERTLATWRGAEGLITFPSFHTTWAILLAWALRRRPVLFCFSVVLNAAVVLSTMTTGWHYLADVVGGVVVCVIVWPLAGWISNRIDRAEAGSGIGRPERACVEGA